jgi:PKHD-type hydroxylase
VGGAVSVIHLPRVIPQVELAAIRGAIDKGAFEPARVPGNDHLELVSTDGEPSSPARRILAALEGHDAFQAAAWPSAITLPVVSRYESGMGDADRTESAFIGASPPMRRDITGIVALNDGSDYEGGDLVIDLDGHRWKGEAGDCLLFAARSTCRVEPVRRGFRLAGQFWVHSAVSEPEERRILFDLTRVLEGLERDGSGEIEAFRHGFFALVRMWSTFATAHRPRR